MENTRLHGAGTRLRYTRVIPCMKKKTKNITYNSFSTIWDKVPRPHWVKRGKRGGGWGLKHKRFLIHAPHWACLVLMIKPMIQTLNIPFSKKELQVNVETNKQTQNQNREIKKKNSTQELKWDRHINTGNVHRRRSPEMTQ